MDHCQEQFRHERNSMWIGIHLGLESKHNGLDYDSPGYMGWNPNPLAYRVSFLRHVWSRFAFCVGWYMTPTVLAEKDGHVKSGHSLGKSTVSLHAISSGLSVDVRGSSVCETG